MCKGEALLRLLAACQIIYRRYTKAQDKGNIQKEARN
jgi:hypothetical protein